MVVERGAPNGVNSKKIRYARKKKNEKDKKHFNVHSVVSFQAF